MTTIQAHRTIPTGLWKSDLTHSSATFEVGHNGVSTFNGKVKKFDAGLSVGDEFELNGSARVESLDIDEENLKAHLLSPEFFDAERHPEIRFHADQLSETDDGLVVSGDLEIKGTTKRVEAKATAGEPGTDPTGAQRVALELETEIDRTEFGLDWNMELPGGGPVLANEVRLLVSLELVKQEA